MKTVALACKCGKVLKAPIVAAGKKGKCPNCGLVFVVPHITPKSKNETATTTAETQTGKSASSPSPKTPVSKETSLASQTQKEKVATSEVKSKTEKSLPKVELSKAGQTQRTKVSAPAGSSSKIAVPPTAELSKAGQTQRTKVPPPLAPPSAELSKAGQTQRTKVPASQPQPSPKTDPSVSAPVEHSPNALPQSTDGRAPKCPVCEFRTEEITYSKVPVIHCETCSYYFARYPAMLHAIKTPEAPPDRKLAIKLKLLLDSRFGKQKEEESNKICLYCGSHYRLYHYYRVPTLGIEQCPKGCGVLIPLSNLKKMQALEQMGNKWEASEIPFPPLP